MDLIDYLLNLAGLLLWFSWRSIKLDPLMRATPATLAGTLRRAEPTRLKRWHFLAALAGLLFARAMFYRVVGPEVNWVPTLDLSVVAPAFPGRTFWTVLLFSVLSFLRVLVVCYFWLLTLALINHRMTAPDPLHKVVLIQLGRIGRWPPLAQAILPLIAVAALWIGLEPVLVSAGVVNRAQSAAHLIGQGFLVGGAIYFSLKFFLPALLFVHLVASYVYLGRSPLWEFVAATSQNLMRPIRFLPLRFGKVDLTPIAGIVLLILLLHTLPMAIRGRLILWKVPVWPQ
jgi:uncharacterized protein YggT (Ycf19 family)